MSATILASRAFYSPALAAHLPARLRTFLDGDLEPGALVTITQEHRDGHSHSTVILHELRLAVQAWEADQEQSGAPAAPEVTSDQATSCPLLPDSTTTDVAGWVSSAGLRGSVVGKWVWVPAHQLGTPAESVRALLTSAAGWKFSQRRQSYFHTCGVEAAAPPKGQKRWGGNLERYHGAASVKDYRGQALPNAAGLRKAAASKRRKA
jgi:hypothetical protein